MYVHQWKEHSPNTHKSEEGRGEEEGWGRLGDRQKGYEISDRVADTAVGEKGILLLLVRKGFVHCHYSQAP